MCGYVGVQENLVESKHHRLARSLRSGVGGRDAKPTAQERDQLAALVQAPPAKTLTATDQDLVWKYRSVHHHTSFTTPLNTTFVHHHTLLITPLTHDIRVKRIVS